MGALHDTESLPLWRAVREIRNRETKAQAVETLMRLAAEGSCAKIRERAEDALHDSGIPFFNDRDKSSCVDTRRNRSVHLRS